MKPDIKIYPKDGHRFLDLKSDFGDLHRNIDDLNYDEKILNDAILEKINCRNITSIEELNILIDKYLD
jgi:hypothetical protein